MYAHPGTCWPVCDTLVTVPCRVMVVGGDFVCVLCLLPGCKPVSSVAGSGLKNPWVAGCKPVPSSRHLRVPSLSLSVAGCKPSPIACPGTIAIIVTHVPMCRCAASSQCIHGTGAVGAVGIELLAVSRCQLLWLSYGLP